jgi:general secretion pathway protein G
MLTGKTPPLPRRTLRSAAGFTLLEMMVVLAIIAILVGIAAGRYDRSVRRAQEATLMSDLKTMRQAIEQYTVDKLTAPQSLEDLVSAGYLREIPKDPITQQRDWQLKFEDVLLSPDQGSAGLTDVHSNSPLVSSVENTPYNTW